MHYTCGRCGKAIDGPGWCSTHCFLTSLDPGGHLVEVARNSFPVTPAATAEQNVAKLSADHAHLKAWNEELVSVLRSFGCDVNWNEKGEVAKTVAAWVKSTKVMAAPRCLAALESKLAEHERVWQEQADEINRLNAELETCRRRHQA